MKNGQKWPKVEKNIFFEIKIDLQLCCHIKKLVIKNFGLDLRKIFKIFFEYSTKDEFYDFLNGGQKICKDL
jgi:hypothetical protein